MLNSNAKFASADNRQHAPESFLFLSLSLCNGLGLQNELKGIMLLSTSFTDVLQLVLLPVLLLAVHTANKRFGNLD